MRQILILSLFRSLVYYCFATLLLLLLLPSLCTWLANYFGRRGLRMMDDDDDDDE